MVSVDQSLLLTSFSFTRHGLHRLRTQSLTASLQKTHFLQLEDHSSFLADVNASLYFFEVCYKVRWGFYTGTCAFACRFAQRIIFCVEKANNKKHEEVFLMSGTVYAQLLLVQQQIERNNQANTNAEHPIHSHLGLILTIGHISADHSIIETNFIVISRLRQNMTIRKWRILVESWYSEDGIVISFFFSFHIYSAFWFTYLFPSLSFCQCTSRQYIVFTSNERTRFFVAWPLERLLVGINVLPRKPDRQNCVNRFLRTNSSRVRWSYTSQFVKFLSR